MLVLRDSATTKINMSSATGDISASGDMTCDNLGAGNSSPDAEISVGHDAANQRPIKIGKGLPIYPFNTCRPSSVKLKS